MVFNVLWLSAVAAAAAAAGFCMGRLSVRAEYEPEEADNGVQKLRRDPNWQMEAAGNAAVRVPAGEWAPADTVQTAPNPAQEERVWTETVSSHFAGAVPGDVDIGKGTGGAPQNTAPLPAGTDRGKLQPGTVERLLGAARIAVSADVRRLRRAGRLHGRRTPQIPEEISWMVGSPVAGYVASYQDGDRPGVMICPGEDKLYAPVAGKIIRLFPMGNAFLFRTEFGAELYIQAGEVRDDLLGRYFRPRVLQNEIVSKGKLLLEFDRQGLGMEGASAMVMLRVENRAYGSRVFLAAEEKVQPGGDLLKVTQPV